MCNNLAKVNAAGEYPVTVLKNNCDGLAFKSLIHFTAAQSHCHVFFLELKHLT